MQKKTKLGIALVLIVLFTLCPIIPINQEYTTKEYYKREVLYTIIDRKLQEKIDWFNVYVQSDITLRNIDKYSGTFQIIHTLRDIDGVIGEVKDSFFLSAGTSYTSTAMFDTELFQDTKGSYRVIQPTITDERLVTKHKVNYISLAYLIIYGNK